MGDKWEIESGLWVTYEWVEKRETDGDVFGAAYRTGIKNNVEWEVPFIKYGFDNESKSGGVICTEVIYLWSVEEVFLGVEIATVFVEESGVFK